MIRIDAPSLSLLLVLAAVLRLTLLLLLVAVIDEGDDGSCSGVFQGREVDSPLFLSDMFEKSKIICSK